MFNSLSEAKVIFIDIETYDPNLKALGPGTFRSDGWIAGVSVKGNGGKSQYYPIGHETGNLDKEKVIAYLNDELSTDIPKCGANILYDLEWLWSHGVTVQGPKYDVQVAEPLLNENKFKYNLESIAQDHLGIGKLPDLLTEACFRKGIRVRKQDDVFLNLYKLPPEDVAAYACRDTDLLEPILEKQIAKLKEEDLWNVFLMETELIDLLLEMRIIGVPVDLDRAEQVRRELIEQEKDLQRRLNDMAGQDVQIWAGENIALAFNRANIPFPRTAKTNQPSFTATWLENHPSDLAKTLVATRKISKMRNDFVEKMVLNSTIKGRIHPQWHPVKHDDGGTVSGRYSSSDPNLQQVPARHPVMGPLIRGLFIPEHGSKWGKFDYSQQEPRVTVHYAFLLGLKGAAEAVEAYRKNPDTDYHSWVADMCSVQRRLAKDINLGLAYGMGIKKMADKLGKSIEETKELFDKYHRAVPFVKQLANNVTRTAQTRGFIKTILGRRRRFETWAPAQFNKDSPDMPLPYDEAVAKWGLPLRRAFTHKAPNALIQGTSADMIKKAMLECFHQGFVPHLTVHDELDFSITDEKHMAIIKDIMLNAVKIEVPLKVDSFLEESWGKCK